MRWGVRVREAHVVEHVVRTLGETERTIRKSVLLSAYRSGLSAKARVRDRIAVDRVLESTMLALLCRPYR